MLCLAVDPGVTGALALLCSRRGLLELADLPTCPNGLKTGRMTRWIDSIELDRLVMSWRLAHDFASEFVWGVVERPIAMPNLPASTIASQFDTFGVIRGSLGLRCNELMVVEPRTWKKHFGLGSDKNESLALARKLYPDAELNRAKFHNRAEALLLGRFAMREVNG